MLNVGDCCVGSYGRFAAASSGWLSQQCNSCCDSAQQSHGESQPIEHVLSPTSKYMVDSANCRVSAQMRHLSLLLQQAAKHAAKHWYTLC